MGYTRTVGRERRSGKRSAFGARFYLHEKMMKSFIRSYLIVFFLPAILIYLTMFFSGYVNVRENNMVTLGSATAQTRTVFDNELYSLLSISSRIAANRDFITVAPLSEEELSESTTMMMYSLSDYFKDTYSMSNQFSNLVLYLPNNGYSISIQHAVPFSTDALELDDMGNGITNLNTWNRMVNMVMDSNAPQLVNSDEGGLLFCKRLPNMGNVLGIMTIPIKSTYIRGILSTAADSQVFGGVVSAAGEILFSTGTRPTALSAEHFIGAEGHFSREGNFYTYAKLDKADAYVVVGVRDRALNANLSRSIVGYVFALLVSVCLFAGLTFRCAVRNYDPIKQLCELATGEKDSELEEFDACGELRASLLNAIDYKREMETSRQIVCEIDNGSKLFSALRTSQADQLLEGAFHMKSIEAGDYDWICVKVRLTDCFSNLFATEAPEGALNFDWMPLFSDCLLQLLNDECSALPMFGTDAMVFLIRLNRETNLRRHLALVSTLLRDSYSYETTIAVSRRMRGTTPFGELFRRMSDDCNFLLESHVATAGESILWYSEIFNGSERISRETIVMERMLAEKLSKGDAAQAVAILDKMRAQLALVEAEERPDGDANVISRQEMADMLRQIVEKDYADPALSVASIAERVQKSPDYVSRCFRSAYEIGLLDYIHKTRIRHAKVLLSEVKDVSISSVARMVGYSTVDSCIRVFKKLEGVTPGAYQKAACTKEENTEHL